MKTPGFTADACFYRSGAYDQTQAAGLIGRGATVEAALMKEGLSCSGSCPAGQLLCECDKHCACCIDGCRCDLNGNVVCDKTPVSNPVSSAAGAVFAGSPGRLLR